jgi:uncharacterized radical SAM superfamily protein
VKKVKVSAALTKEGLLSLMSEKANKNGNIPIKEFRAFLKELNNEKAEEFFETLQAEELVENRKTMVHLYSEAERKELGEKK